MPNALSRAYTNVTTLRNVEHGKMYGNNRTPIRTVLAVLFRFLSVLLRYSTVLLFYSWLVQYSTQSPIKPPYRLAYRRANIPFAVAAEYKQTIRTKNRRRALSLQRMVVVAGCFTTLDGIVHWMISKTTVMTTIICFLAIKAAMTNKLDYYHNVLSHQ